MTNSKKPRPKKPTPHELLVRVEQVTQEAFHLVHAVDLAQWTFRGIRLGAGLVPFAVFVLKTQS